MVRCWWSTSWWDMNHQRHLLLVSSMNWPLDDWPQWTCWGSTMLSRCFNLTSSSSSSSSSVPLLCGCYRPFHCLYFNIGFVATSHYVLPTLFLLSSNTTLGGHQMLPHVHKWAMFENGHPKFEGYLPLKPPISDSFTTISRLQHESLQNELHCR